MKSFREWLHAAGKAKRKKRPADAVAYLREAEALVVRAGEWADLAEKWATLGPDDLDDAVRCAELALSHPRTDLAAHRSVARLYANDLGDAAAARRTLDRWRATCEARPDTPLDEWSHLATTYVSLVADRGVARTVLDRGLARTAAPSIDALCKLAEVHGKELGDLETARALIERAAVLVEAQGPDESSPGVGPRQRAARRPRRCGRGEVHAVLAARSDFQHPKVAWLLDEGTLDPRDRKWRPMAAQYLDEPSRGDPSLAHLAGIAERLRRA